LVATDVVPAVADREWEIRVRAGWVLRIVEKGGIEVWIVAPLAERGASPETPIALITTELTRIAAILVLLLEALVSCRGVRDIDAVRPGDQIVACHLRVARIEQRACGHRAEVPFGGFAAAGEREKRRRHSDQHRLPRAVCCHGDLLSLIRGTEE